MTMIWWTISDIVKSVANTGSVSIFLSLSLSISTFLSQSPKDTFPWLALVKNTASRSLWEKKTNGIQTRRFCIFSIFYVFPIVNPIRKWDDHIWKRITFALGDEVADRFKFTLHESRAKWKKKISTKTMKFLVHRKPHWKLEIVEWVANLNTKKLYAC